MLILSVGEDTYYEFLVIWFTGGFLFFTFHVIYEHPLEEINQAWKCYK